MSDQRRARIEVWREPIGAWRWRYVLDDGDEALLELASNDPEPTADAAIAAAHLAYPDVPIQMRAPAAAGGTGPGSHRWVWAALTGGVSVALMALALRARRWWLVPVAPVIASGVAARIRRQLP